MTRYWPLFLLLVCGRSLAAVEALISPNPVLAGEVFELSITQSPAGDGDPDLGTLPEGLRELDRRLSQSHQIINGQVSSNRSWTISLVASRPGQYTLPIAPLDGEPVPAVSIRVQAPDPQAQKSADIFAQFRASTERSWVGAEVSLHLQVYVAGELDSGSLPDPVADGFVIEKISESNDGEELIGNTRYRVLDRRYVAFAERTGTLRIRGPVFRGQLIDRQRRSRFPSFSLPTRGVQAVAPDIELQVAAADTSTKAAWLPARRVRLAEELDLTGPAEQNQAFSRSVQLLIDGQLHTQLPSFNWPEPPREQGQTYAEPLQSHTQAFGDGVRANLIQRFVHIPQQDRIRLPEIRLPWFNIKTGGWDEAVLPAREIPVRGAVTSTPTPLPRTTPSEPAEIPAASAVGTGGENRLWRVIALASSAGWIATLLSWWWLHRRRIDVQPRTEVTPQNPRLRQARDQAIAHLGAQEWRAAATALGQWGQAAGLIPNNAGLLQLATAVESPELAQQLRALSAQLYGQGQCSAATLIAALRAYKHQASKPSRTPQEALPGLYPHG